MYLIQIHRGSDNYKIVCVHVCVCVCVCGGGGGGGGGVKLNYKKIYNNNNNW